APSRSTRGRCRGLGAHLLELLSEALDLDAGYLEHDAVNLDGDGMAPGRWPASSGRPRTAASTRAYGPTVTPLPEVQQRHGGGVPRLLQLYKDKATRASTPICAGPLQAALI
uniref:Uncharacterized protein n=1 Tax=Setaria italica TaxID=4555 RepID=A0A0Q3VDD4_SETIT